MLKLKCLANTIMLWNNAIILNATTFVLLDVPSMRSGYGTVCQVDLIPEV